MLLKFGAKTESGLCTYLKRVKTAEKKFFLYNSNSFFG